jgi:hypothetical protein
MTSEQQNKHRTVHLRIHCRNLMTSGNHGSVFMSRWLIAIGLVTMVAGIGGTGYGVWTIWHQHYVITSAKAVRAKVVGHETTKLKGGGFAAKVPLVKYEYTVDQKVYTSQTVTPEQLMLPDTWADSVFIQFPVGAQTQAKYDPQDPSKAFLIGKYAVQPYLPVLIGLVTAALGLGIVCDQILSQETPRMTPTTSGTLALVAKQHHLTRARVFRIAGLLGLVCGAPAILHHLSVSTAPHERMGFLLEGAYGIAVLTVMARSARQFRQASGFGTPVVTIDRSPTIGQPLQVKVSLPTRFAGTVSWNADLRCEAQDTSLFNSSEKYPKTVLDQQLLSVSSEPVTRNGEITRTVDLLIPHEMPPSTPLGSGERIHMVWSLVLNAVGDRGRKAEWEYILAVANAAT